MRVTLGLALLGLFLVVVADVVRERQGTIGAAEASVAQAPFVRWEGAFQPAYKLAAGMAERAGPARAHSADRMPCCA